MKAFCIAIATLGLVVLFQNCANNNQVSFAETPSIAAEDTPSNQQEESQSTVNPTPVVHEAPPCFPDGYVFTTGDSLPFIHYHKCDGEIEMWRKLGESQCCSRKVTIEDIESYDFPTCPRFRGQMTCVNK